MRLSVSEYEKVANWIINESDKPILEIEWLLKVAYTNKKPKLTFTEAWNEVLELSQGEEK